MLWKSVKTHVSEPLGIACVEVMLMLKLFIVSAYVPRVDSGLLRTYSRALRNTTRHKTGPRAIIWRLECQRAPGVVSAKAPQLVMFNAEPIL